MSLILDALKKLDREKAFIRRVTANIADEILKADPDRPRKSLPRFIPAVLLTVCVTAALTYVAITNLGFSGKKEPSPGPTSPAASRPPVESSAPSQAAVKAPQEEISTPSSKDPTITGSQRLIRVDSAPARKPGIAAQPVPRVESAPLPQEPARRTPERMAPSAAKDQIVAESKTPAVVEPAPALKPEAAKQPAQLIEPVPSPRNTARQVLEGVPSLPAKDRDFAEKGQASLPPVEKKAEPNTGTEGTGTGSAIPQSAAAPPLTTSSPLASSLRVTGIVWSDDPAGRRAMINGAIVTEGGVIQGAKVVEILPNRVRLVQDGQPFEIQLF